MDDFLDESILLPTILKLELNSLEEYNSLPSQILKLNPPKKFPIVDNVSEIDELFKSAQNITEAINKTSFPFDFSFEIVTTTCSYFGPSIQTSPNYTAILALNSFFAILKSGSNIEHIPIILELLKMIVTSSIDQKYRFYAASAFASVYNFEKLQIMPDDFQSYIQSFRSFFIDCDDLPVTSYKLIVHLANLLYSQKRFKSLDLFTKNLDPIINKCHERIPKFVILDLIEIIGKPPQYLSPNTMKAFSKITKFYKPEYLIQYINFTVQKIAEEIENEEIISESINTENSVALETSQGAVAVNTFTVSNGTTFDGVVDIEKTKPIIHAFASCEDLVSPHVKEMINNIYEILAESDILSFTFIEHSLNILQNLDKNDKHKIDKAAAYIYAFIKCSNFFVLSSSIEKLFNTFIFDPSLNFYNTNKEFKALSTLRNDAVYLLSMFKMETIQKILNKMFDYPYLIGDVFIRMATQDRITFPTSSPIDTTLPLLISHFMHEYRMKVCDGSCKEAICQARIASFYFIIKLLKNKTVTSALFSWELFVNEISLMIFENPTRKIALDIVSNYLQEKNSFKNEFILILLPSQISSLFMSPLTDKTMECTTDIVEFMNALIANYPSYYSYFKEIISNSINRLADIMQIPEASRYFIQEMSLLRTVYNIRGATQREFVQIETGVKRIYGNNLNFNVLKCLLELAANSEIKNLRDPFEVVQTKAIIAIIKSFAESDYIIHALNILKQLCDFSEKNRLDFHNYKLDLCIIDFIKNSKNKDAIDLALSILQKISSCSSSATVVNRFVSLFCPINEKYLQPHHQVVLNFFNKIISDASQLPECGYPVSINNVASIKGIPSKALENGTLVMWLFSTEKVGTTVFAVIGDEADTTISLAIIDGKLTTIVETPSKVWQGPSQFDVPLNQWFKVSFSFFAEKVTSYYSVSIWSSDFLKQRQVYPGFPIKQGNIIVQLCSNVVAKENGTFIGPIGLFDELTEDKINLVFETNPHTCPTDLKPYMYVIPTKEGDRIALRGNTQTKIDYSLPKNPKSFSFIDIVSSRIGYSVLTPLFAEIDFTYENGEEFPNHAVAVVQLIRNAFALNPRGQAEFYENNGFPVISYLLQLSKSSNLTYELYSSFVCLASTLTHELLIADLYCYILTNFSLWKDSCDIELITRHWGYSLFPGAPELFIKTLPFDRIIQLMRSFFYYEPIEAGIIAELWSRKQYKLNIEKIRKNLFVAAYSAATLTKQDQVIKTLMKNIMTSGDIKQQTELLQFLLAVLSIQVQEIPEESSLNQLYTPLLIIHNLVASKNAKVISLMLDVIIKMHEIFNITELSIDEHLQLILEQLPPSAITKELFDYVIEMMKTKPILFPFCCYLAYNIGPEAEDEIFNKFEPMDEFTKVKFWSVWPAMIFVHSNGIMRIKISNFIISLGCKAWMPFLNAVDFVGRSIDQKIFRSEHDFISAAGASVLSHSKSISEEESDSFLSLIRNFVFLKPFGYFCDGVNAIDKMFISSLDSIMSIDDDQEKETKTLKESVNNISAMFDSNTPSMMAMKPPYKLTINNINDDNEPESKAIELKNSLKQTRKERHFGVRVSEKGEWQDSDLVQIGLAVYELKPVKRHESTIIISCAFLLRSSTARAVSFIAPYIIKSDLPPEICIYNDRALRTNNTTLGNDNRNETAINAFEQYEKFSENDSRSIFANKYFEFLGVTSAKELQLLEYTHQKFINTVLSESTMMQEVFSRSSFTTRKIWRRIWRSLTIEGNPWSQSIVADNAADGTEIRVLKKKRESLNCILTVPMKVRRYYGRLKQIVNSPTPISDYSEETEEVHSIDVSDTIDAIHNRSDCFFIGLNKVEKGTITFSNESIVITKGKVPKKVISLKSISHIVIKPWFKEATAIEIYQHDGSNYFINMRDNENIELFASITNISLPKLRSQVQLNTQIYKFIFEETSYTKHWVLGKISTFAYLVALNIFSGRTFNSILQYPIFPWILSKYDGKELDLNDPKSYRNLAKPIGALDQQKLSELARRARGRNTIWLYDSSYSTPSMVSKLLSNIEPFASFTSERVISLQKEYTLALTALGNYTELTPEFFFQPEVVENMKLPEWAKSPFDFIYMHRKALESDYVSSTINKWIDLIWGNAQSGELAVSSMNTFNPELYQNSKGAKANPNVLITCGQIPPQLFTDYHPKRNAIKAVPIEIKGTIKITTSKLVGVIITKHTHSQMNVLAIESDGNSFAFKITNDLLKQLMNPTKPVVDLTQIINRNLNLQSLFENNDTLLFSKKIPNFEKINNLQDDISHVSALASGSYVLIGKEKDAAYVINPPSNTYVKLPTNDIYLTCAASNDNYIAVADSESLIYVFRAPTFTKPHMTIQVCASQIKCIAVSANFHVVACGTKDNSILLLSMTTRTISRIINLDNCHPTNIIITSGWGMIVVFTKYFDETNISKAMHKVYILSCNGDIVKTETIKSPPTHFVQYTDYSGFDHIIYSDENKNIYEFEAYFPENRRLITTEKLNVIAIEAWHKINNCIVVTNDANVHFLSI